jgi:BASS family bile acid:Na+ symporter
LGPTWQPLGRLCLALAALALSALAAGLALGRPGLWNPAAVALAVLVAFGLGVVPPLRGYRFTAWVVAAVVAALVYPAAFQHWGPIDLRNRWLLLVVVQLVMFGMGTQMTLREFSGVMRMPRAVLVGSVCQFSIMPLVGYGLTRLFRFPPEISAGIVLIGACSSGLASNVLTYLAKGNLPLSITLTACNTLVAPVMTPLWMTLLAHEYVEVKFLAMMAEVIKIVVVPVAAALLCDYLHHASPRARRAVGAVALLAVAYLAALALGGWRLVESTLADTPARGALELAFTVVTFGLIAVLAAVVYRLLTRRLPGLDRVMPLLSMGGIIYFTAVTTAAGRESLLTVGGLLFVAAALHNTAGYCLGYGISRAAGLDVRSARTVAFEVGLHNGGMASGLAAAMEKLGTVGLPAAIFSPWMNVSGSVLANYWRKRPVPGGDAAPLPSPRNQREMAPSAAPQLNRKSVTEPG